MAAEINPVENPVDYEPFFRAVRSGDWRKTKEFLTLHPNAITATNTWGTALHVAMAFGQEQIAEELVQLMTDKDLETTNFDGWTALARAARYSVKLVECIVAKNKKLLGIAQHLGLIPIVIAASSNRWSIVRYLYPITPLEDLMPDKGPSGPELVIHCLQAKQYDIAWDLLGRSPRLFCTRGLQGCPMYEYARLPFAFPSGTSLKFWQQWIYKCIHVKPLSVVDVRINVQNQEKEQGDQRNSTDLGLLQGLPSRLSKFLGINHIRELKLHHVRSREILDIACDLIKDLDLDNEEMMVGDTVFLAVQNGIVELVITLCKAKPQLLGMKLGRNGKYIFHHAIECRQENVYSLIYGTGERNNLATLKDGTRKSMLDYAGMLSPLAREKLDGIAGAALQMQRERQWYKEVESIVVTAPGASPFKEDFLTAARLFTQNHEELHEKGEKWMKDTASSYIIVSALIITIMFAAAFTVPGGNNQEGLPVFLNEKLFMVFIVSDTISLFSSVTSALMFLCILTSRYAEDDFLKSLPTKMIIGLSTLFISVATMMVAFSSAIFQMLRDKSRIITPIIFLAGIPVILFVWMQFPLLVEIFVSTYGRGIFNRKVKPWI